NFFVAAGFNSIGIASGAGAGRAVAEWIAGGEPPMDLWDVDIRRVAPFQGNPAYLRDRTVEMVGVLYAIHWPFQQPVTARAVRQRLCANDVDVMPGRLVYTQMLNARGGIEADLTVTRLASDAFLVVTSASASTHNSHWIRRHLGESRAVLTDVTSSEAVLG